MIFLVKLKQATKRNSEAIEMQKLLEDEEIFISFHLLFTLKFGKKDQFISLKIGKDDLRDALPKVGDAWDDDTLILLGCHNLRT